jgi:hypothetical protein
VATWMKSVDIFEKEHLFLGDNKIYIIGRVNIEKHSRCWGNFSLYASLQFNLYVKFHFFCKKKMKDRKTHKQKPE